MPTETITESKKAPLALDKSVAAALSKAGRDLASKTTWWGAEKHDPVEEDDRAARTVIRCTESSAGMYEVSVRNAVGVIAVGDLEILVEPKIPPSHFLYLLEASGFLPKRMDPKAHKAHAGEGEHLWDFIVNWYADSMEKLMRRGVVLDYVGHAGPLPFVRGRVNTQATAMTYYQGRLDIECEYEDFGQDTPLNRLLSAAGTLITSSPRLSPELRKRMRAILTRFEDVGTLQPGDLRAMPDRRTAHYSDAVALARNILGGVHRMLSHGEHLVWTFLIPTPLLVETGLRRELARRLESDLPVEKRRFAVEGLSNGMNPDLVFGDVTAVGDVKYKLFTSGEWPRSDLNQIVAFNAAARTKKGKVANTKHGIVVGFQKPGTPSLPNLTVGNTQITYLAWRADEDVIASDAAEELTQQLREKLLPVVPPATDDVVDAPDDHEDLRCANCQRTPRPDENAQDDWRVESDGVGELLVFCPECWQREFGGSG